MSVRILHRHVIVIGESQPGLQARPLFPESCSVDSGDLVKSGIPAAEGGCEMKNDNKSQTEYRKAAAQITRPGLFRVQHPTD